MNEFPQSIHNFMATIEEFLNGKKSLEDLEKAVRLVSEKEARACKLSFVWHARILSTDLCFKSSLTKNRKVGFSMSFLKTCLREAVKNWKEFNGFA